MKEPNKTLKKSYRSVNLHKFGQNLVPDTHTHIYFYVHICSTNLCECDNGYYIIKYLACGNLNLPTQKLDLDFYTEIKIKLNSNTTLHICKMKVIINPNILIYKINYMYLPHLPTNIESIKKLFELKQFYYVNSLNQKKLIEYKQDEMENLEKLLDNLSV
jgi:hypothetical protein